MAHDIKRKWDVLSKEMRKPSIDGIITFFKEERGEVLEMIAIRNMRKNVLSERL